MRIIKIDKIIYNYVLNIKSNRLYTDIFGIDNFNEKLDLIQFFFSYIFENNKKEK